MKAQLNNKEKKVLYRIQEEMATESQDCFPEFPELTSKQITKAINTLNELNMIIFDEGTRMWKITELGEKFITDNYEAFKEIKEEFNKNLFK